MSIYNSSNYIYCFIAPTANGAPAGQPPVASQPAPQFTQPAAPVAAPRHAGEDPPSPTRVLQCHADPPQPPVPVREPTPPPARAPSPLPVVEPTPAVQEPQVAADPHAGKGVSALV